MTELPASKNAIDNAGVRIASGGGSDEDEALLRAYIEVCDGALTTLTERLRNLGFEPTSRLKNRETILDKVRRDKSKITRIRDIAGCRIVVDGSLFSQNQVVQAVTSELDIMRTIDRRSQPKSGYRAVHLEATVAGRPVEVQVRTPRQHQWAELFERLGDIVGREIRYSEPIVMPPHLTDDRSGIDDAVSRLVRMMLRWSTALFDADNRELVVETARSVIDDLPTSSPGLATAIANATASQAEVDAHDTAFRSEINETLAMLDRIYRPTLD